MRVTIFAIFLLVAEIACVSVQETNFQSTQKKIVHLGFSGLFWERVGLGNLDSSNKCHKALKAVLQNADGNHAEAKKLLSVSGSFPKDLESKSYVDGGDYRGCLGLKLKNIYNSSGRYCALSLQPDFEKIGKSWGLTAEEIEKVYPLEFSKKLHLDIKIGLCVPSACSPDDVDKLVKEVVKSVYWKQNEVAACQDQKSLVEKVQDSRDVQKFFLLLVGIYIFLIIMAAFMDFASSKSEEYKETISPWYYYLSPQKNFDSLTTQDQGQLKELNGLRIFALSMTYIIHAMFWFAGIPAFAILSNMRSFNVGAQKLLMQPFYSGWFFEGLIVMGALSSTSNIYRKVKNKKSFNEYFWILFERFTRYQPLILFALICEILLPIFGNGPFFPLYNRNKCQDCTKIMFHHIFGTVNGIDIKQICSLHLWTLSMEMQFLVISVILVFLFYNHKILGWVLALSLLFGGYIYTVNELLAHNIKPIYHVYPFKLTDTYNYLTKFWVQPSTHIWTHVGVVIGVKLIADGYDELFPRKWIIRTFIFFSTLVGINLFLPIPFTIYEYDSTPTITVLYITYTCIVFAVWGIFYFALNPYEFRKSIPNTSAKTSKPSNEQSADHNHNEMPQKSISKVPKQRAGFWTILRKVLRAGYFIHGSVLNWYFTSFEKQIPALSLSHLWHIICMYVLICFGGFVSYIFLVGPWERFYADFRGKLRNWKFQTKKALD